jgi:short-subunit dehydrogenase
VKTILVTGASSGIGRSLALRAARAGMCVIGVGRDAARLGSLSESAAGAPGRIETIVADLSESGASERIVAFALEKGGSIDVLVNNAGFASAGSLVSQSDDDLRRQFATHVIAPVSLVREALPSLRASRGHVIMVGSGVARVPTGGLGAYSPAKAALRSATALLRRELKASGIAVTYVDPAVVDTPFMERAGLAGAPKPLRVSPEFVARKIWHAIARRPRELNAVPWQTAAVTLGEHFPRITDAIMSRSARLVGVQQKDETPPNDVRRSDETPPPKDVIPSVASNSERSRGTAETVQSALEPLARKMERSGLRIEFVESLLATPGEKLELGEVAMRWAGMPNKHERALTQEMLQALASAGYLEAAGDDAWTVSAKRSTIS